jgi:hypothetical protein
MNEPLGTLEKTIASHAATLADKEWHNEQRPILFELLVNCSLAARLNERTGDLVEPGTLSLTDAISGLN